MRGRGYFHVPPELPSQGAEQVQFKKGTGQIPFMVPRELKETKWGKSSADPSLVWMPLVSNPLSLPPSLCCAGSKLRLLLSVWRAGRENVAATSISVCVCVRFSQCMCASPSSWLWGRQRTSALNSPLTPPPYSPLSLSLSVSPTPSLPSLLSADINTQGTAAKIPGKVVKILGGYWIERVRVKRQQTVLSVWVHTAQIPTFCGHSLVLQVLADVRNIKGKENPMYTLGG